jgi:transcriptional regulator with XRE-family HTH domain
MVTREEILSSPEYWFAGEQNEFFRQVIEYMERENLNQTQLAERLGVSKGYISQLLKGEFNHSLKKLIELSLSIGMVPQIKYKTLAQVLAEDKRPRYSEQETAQAFDSNKSSMLVQEPDPKISKRRRKE